MGETSPSRDVEHLSAATRARSPWSLQCRPVGSDAPCIVRGCLPSDLSQSKTGSRCRMSVRTSRRLSLAAGVRKTAVRFKPAATAARDQGGADTAIRPRRVACLAAAARGRTRTAAATATVASDWRPGVDDHPPPPPRRRGRYRPCDPRSSSASATNRSPHQQQMKSRCRTRACTQWNGCSEPTPSGDSLQNPSPLIPHPRRGESPGLASRTTRPDR